MANLQTKQQTLLGYENLKVVYFNRGDSGLFQPG